MIGLYTPGGVDGYNRRGPILKNQTYKDSFTLRRCILLTLYDLFQEHPLAEVELSQLETSCQTSIKALNWNMVYLEKKGFVSLSPSAECLPYAACSASITGSGIDLVEDAKALSRQFPLDAA